LSLITNFVLKWKMLLARVKRKPKDHTVLPAV